VWQPEPYRLARCGTLCSFSPICRQQFRSHPIPINCVYCESGKTSSFRIPSIDLRRLAVFPTEHRFEH